MIRKLSIDDASQYQTLRLLALKTDPEAFSSTYEREVKFSIEMVQERIRPTKDKFVIGYFDDDGLLVGIVTFIRESSLKTSHKGNVFGMYVHPEMRGKGIGKALIAELIRLTRVCEGLEQINITVVSSNQTAKRLYESMGFKVYGTERYALKYLGKYYDADLMVITL